MSTLSDVQAIQDSLKGVWAKSRGHILSHILLAGLVLFVFGLPRLMIQLPALDAKQILNSDWYQIAKDTGLIYVLLAVPFVIITVYGVLLRIVGGILSCLLFLVFPPKPHQRPRLLNRQTLEPLALLLKKDDFDAKELGHKAGELMVKYRAQKGESWDHYESALNDLGPHTLVLMSDVLVFLVLWVALFGLFDSSWLPVTHSQFWLVVLALLSVIWMLWSRVRRAVSFVPELQVIAVSAMIRTDPDMAPILKVSEDQRERVLSQIDKLLADEQPQDEPSLRRFICCKLGLCRTQQDPEAKIPRGRPFTGLYERGQRFSRDSKRNRRYDWAWLAEYGSYLYYRFHNRVSDIARNLWTIVRILVTGVP